MKAYVTHDEDGNILSINMPSTAVDANIHIVPDSGQQVCEVNIAGRAEDFADEGTAAGKLIEIAHEFRIDVPARKGRLVSARKKMERKSKGRARRRSG